jgi:quinohemoprotein ethanol dehydrogenase
VKATTRAGRLAVFALSVLVAFVACFGDDNDATKAKAAKDARPQDPVEVRRAAAEAVDQTALRVASGEAANWLSTGRTQDEQRFSPLSQINAGNVRELKLAWRFETGLRRGHEATPLVVDGTMYLTGSWSVVFALEATTGKLLWKWDPKVSQEVGAKACCDVVNRGVAIFEGKVFVGVLDGRLVALDAATGEPVWQVQTFDPALDYTITGAPRIADGKVVIGNGGAEYGVRGFVAAYDPETGKRIWRTYTVPGDPSRKQESAALEKALPTWKGDEWWKVGGGGTVWDSMAYDPELGLLYVGTGNGSPWAYEVRSPGGGDNLYLSSILALDPKTGEIRWHFQTTPGDNWDFTATQHMILADLDIDGKRRKVIMQAPKNGFFYVLDRETGEFLSAKPFVTVTWADGVDPLSGRPIQNGSGDYPEGFALVMPTYFGGHNWQPMSFNPQTGLVYIPAQEIGGPYQLDGAYRYAPGDFNTGVDMQFLTLFNRELVSGHLLAWDPVRQREVWRHPHGIPWNGGTLTTAGNLVFEGTADGRFLALRASDGTLLWQSHSAGSGIIAAPMTFSVDGVQYVSVVAGWGGAFAMVGGDASAAANVESRGAVVTYALSGDAITPEAVRAFMAARDPSLVRGADLYHAYCSRCHGANGIAGGVNPDLRDRVHVLHEAFDAVTLNGLSGTGMPGFEGRLDAADVSEIRRYLMALPRR